MRFLAAVGFLVLLAPSHSGAQAQMEPVLLARFNAFIDSLHAKDVKRAVTFVNEADRAGALKYYTDGATVFAGIQMKVIEAAASGDVGFVAAQFSFPPTTPERGGVKGSVLMAWKRVKGEWVIAHSSFMDDPPPTPAKK